MIQLYLLIFLAGSFLFTTLGSWLLLKLKNKKNNSILRNYFYISSHKSSTAAQLLGGLPIALSILITMISLNYLEIVNELEQTIISRGILSAIPLLAYGYLDDRFELRPIVKLTFQTITVLTFTLSTTHLISTNQNINLLFTIYFITGMALINGNNLLDGLDGLAVKLNSGNLLGFLILGQLFHSLTVTLISISAIGALFGFYLFNKKPAKLYLGEIGGTFLGFTYLTLLTLLHTTDQSASLSTLSLILIPVVLPIIELAVSFLRRLLNKKAPFKGDRLHLHYILVNHYHLSINRTTTYYALTQLVLIMLGITLYHYVPTYIALGTSTLAWILINHHICHNYWSIAVDLHSPSFHLLLDQLITRKEIQIINLNRINDFEFEVLSIPQKAVTIKKINSSTSIKRESTKENSLSIA